VLSTIYRIMVGIAIILIVAWSVPIIGQLMALGGIITWIVMPVVMTVKYLALNPELHRKRGRATAFVVGTFALIVAAIGLIPFWVYVQAVGVLEPEKQEVLHAQVPGVVSEVRARDGDWLEAGQVILVTHDRELDARLEEAQANLRAATIRLQRMSVESQAQKQIVEQDIASTTKQIDDLNRQKTELTIKTSIAGRLIAPDIENFIGRFLDRGTEVATVATLDQLQVKAALMQSDVELVKNGAESEIRLAGRPNLALHGAGVRVLPAARERLPSAVLGHGGGGDIAVDPKDERGDKPVVKQFEIRIQLPNEGAEIYPGQRAYVRMKVDKKPLLWQWGRRFLQLIEESNNSKWT
jgi:putative peptide zinc metalloprotease protein